DLRDFAWGYYARLTQADRGFIRLPSGTMDVAFAPDGKSLVVACTDGNLYLWDVPGRRQRASLKAQIGQLYAVAYSPDGKLMASGGSGGTVKLWDSASGKERSSMKLGAERAWQVTFSPDGKSLAAGGGSWNDSTRQWFAGEVKVLDIASGQE